VPSISKANPAEKMSGLCNRGLPVSQGRWDYAGRMATTNLRYVNNAIASSASTPPVIEMGANGALAATSALDSMI